LAATRSAQERGSPLAQPLADLDRALGHGQGGHFDRAGAVRDRGRHREHLAAQVDGGRAGVGDPLDLGLQPGAVPALAFGLPDRERHPERARHPQQRRAPHRQRRDRVDQLVHRGQVEDAKPVRQGPLVDGDDVAVAPADNVVKNVVAHGTGRYTGGSRCCSPTPARRS
jgi:hypothetical protein